MDPNKFYLAETSISGCWGVWPPNGVWPYMYTSFDEARLDLIQKLKEYQTEIAKLKELPK